MIEPNIRYPVTARRGGGLEDDLLAFASEASGLPSSALPMKRMDRNEFFGALAPLDEERLRKALWNLYWRGSAAMRERIEAELDPEARERRQRAASRVVDPDWVLREVQEFVA